MLRAHVGGRARFAAALGLVLGCGGKSGSRDNPPALEAGDAGVVEVAADAGSPPPSEPADAGAPARPPMDPEPANSPDDWLRGDILASSLVSLLETACGECHAGGNAEGGLGDILDIGTMFTTGMIVPGSSDESPLFRRIADGSMPPAGASPRLTAGEVELMRTFIDTLQLVDPKACTPLPLMSEDAAYAALLADLQARPAEDRPYLRYLSIGYLDSLDCGRALEREQRALFKSLNSVSRAPTISVPAAVDGAGRLYRVDLRAYAFDREIDLEDDGTVDFPDAWRAIEAGVGAYAVQLTGPEADEAQRLTGTAVPLLPVNAFVNAVNQGDLYYALVGARRNVFDTQAELGMDIVVQTDDLELRRAAFETTVAPSSPTYVVSRWVQGPSSTRYYWSLEAEDRRKSETVFADPIGSYFGDQIIYQLPNGLQAYAVTDGSGDRLAQVTRGCIGTCDTPATLNAAACHSCHVDGLVPVRDEVRPYMEQSPQSYDLETQADVAIVYPLQPDFDALLAADSALHQAAAEQAGVPRGQPDPISLVFFEFERTPLHIDDVAAELGVPWEALRDSLPRLPALAALAVPGGSVDRAQLTSAWLAARCELLTNARNRPVSCP